MKIVFAGTPEFASKHLELLIESDNTILKVLTQPDRKSGRGKKIKFSEVKEVALREGIEVLQPESLKTDEFANTLRELSPDLLLVVAYGIIVPQQILKIPKYGCINIHASLLPRWRGASPMEHAILSGDKKSGITFMKMTKGLDEGPIFETHECSLDADDQLTDLENKLFNLSKNNLIPFLKTVGEKNKLILQKDRDATFAPKISKEFLQIRWNQETADEVVRKINALGAKYGTYTFLGKKRIKVFRASKSSGNISALPGTINEPEYGLQVNCKGDTSILINELQMEGKAKLTGGEFLRGYKSLISKYPFS